MHFEESVTLARETPALKALVQRCDELLNTLDSHAVILPERWSKAIGEEVGRIDGVLGSYVEASLLRAELALECDCGAVCKTHEKSCSSCDLPLGTAAKRTAYVFADPSRAKRGGGRYSSSKPVRVAPERPIARFGIITALPYEFAGVKIMLDNSVEWNAPGSGAGRRYVVGDIPALSGGTHKVTSVLLPDTGNNQAAARATLLLEHFPEVEYVIMCGIAGGVPQPGVSEHDVRLGDLVACDRGGVIQYDFGKQAGGTWTPRHPPRPPGAELLEAVKYLSATEHEGKRPWETYLSRGSGIERAERPQDNENAKGESVTYPSDAARRAGYPRLFLAPIASSNTLLKDEKKRDRLAKQHGVKAIEMEGSGIADATWLRDTGYMVVRGIVDYCDPEKGDRWHKYAAVAAAAYVRALIESMPSQASS